MMSVGNLVAIFAAIKDASVPDRFSHEFLKQLGFTSSNDRSVIPVMKAMRFLDDNSVPTERYKRFRDDSIAGTVMAEGLRDAYADLFKVNEKAYELSGGPLKSAVKRITDKGDSAADKMARTFKTLADMADWTGSAPTEDDNADEQSEDKPPRDEDDETPPPPPPGMPLLRHDIHVHLPIATDVKVYDAIFRSLREHFG
jgi:hypothetical protein